MILFHKKYLMKRIYKSLASILLILTVIFSYSFTESYFEISKHIEIFTGLYKELNTFYVDETDPGELMKEGIDKMLKKLDPYTTYIPESEIEDFRFMTTGEYGGIGAIITKRGDYVYITEPYEGFPAHKAGLIASDKILEINGKSAKDKTTEEVSKILKGQPNTSVTLLIERKFEQDPFEVTFNRKKVSIKSVPYTEYISNDIGYVKLRSFTKNCSNDLKTAILSLQEQGELEGLIIDLRNNPGGLLNESVNIVNLFVNEGEEVVSTKGKIKSWEKQYFAKYKPIETQLPLVVLINSASASASEIVAGALQDLDRAVIIGERSYGKGLVQQTRKLAYNAQLKLTVAKYYIPSGRCIQALDYSNRNDDGSVGKIADSLMTPFKTRNGRTVYDGGGIQPDIIIEKNNLENIIVSLFKEQLFFDYATEFKFKTDSISKDFILSDNQFNDFIGYLSDKEYAYKTKTEEALENLKEKAKKEDYFNQFQTEYRLLSDKLIEHKKDDLFKNKEKITEVLTAEIMSRYYYQSGRIRGGLNFDSDVEKALQILKNSNEYNSILANE